MKIFDPLYGSFHLNDPIRSLCQTPEVRRLSQIRLLNTLTPSLATLGELRRYSHTLGVLYLAFQNQHFRGNQEREAFSAAVLLHDIGTPPFGHLFEYHLKERFSWNHECVIGQILAGNDVRENRAHQIFARTTAQFAVTLKRKRMDVSLISDIVSGKHRLSQLLFGSLDFDNLDNVARMNWALNQVVDFSAFKLIAEHLDVTDGGDIVLPVACDESVEEWLRLRKAAYEVLVFDPPTVAAQAVLSESIECAIDAGLLTEADWSLTDEELIDKLLKEPLTKKQVMRHFLGRVPDLVFLFQIQGSLQNLGFESRKTATDRLSHVLEKHFGKASIGYIFQDRGTFSKSLLLTEPNTGEIRRVGSTSESVVFYAFSKTARFPAHQMCASALLDVLQEFGIEQSSIVRCKIGAKSNQSDFQQTFRIPA